MATAERSGGGVGGGTAFLEVGACAGDEPIEREDIVFVDYEDESRLEDVDKLVACDLSEPYSIFTYRYFLNRFPDLCILAVSGSSGEVCGCVVGKIDVEEVPLPPVVGEGRTAGETTDVLMSGENDVGCATTETGDTRHATTTTTTTTTATAQPIDADGNGAGNTGVNTAVQTGYIGMLAVSKSHRRKGIGKDLVRRVLRRMRDRGCESVTLETEVSNVTAQKLYQNHFGFIREELLVRYYLNCGDAYRLRLWF
mmetsp:Transcript_2040/g.5399  ORF Transcript_2040/g.5399 Transcript_2040/m.5399 type:complete len:254 (-) Transcript_2040:422-1183(-)